MSDFMSKLKALLGGESRPDAEPDADLDEARPWDSPSVRPPVGMSGGQMMGGAGMPPQGPPRSIADDPMALAMKIARQKRMAAMMLPERTWNK